MIVRAVWPWAHWAFPLAGAITVFSSHFELLGPVIDHGGDSAHHLLNQYVLSDAVKNGDNPLGPVGLELGMPLLRLYQSLFYLAALAMDAGLGVDVRLAHNLLVALCFSLSPLAYCFCLRRIGAGRLAAGLGSLASLVSVGAFANSFEAYHGIGIATQSMGALFFPLFLGAFAGMLDGRGRVGSAALLFALAFLSHAAFAFYCAVAGALYVLVAAPPLASCVRRLPIFCALGLALVSFWLLPFLDHAARLRPIPDSVFHGEAKQWWFTGATEDEAVALAVSGRLLDDPRVAHSKQTDRLDKLADKLDISPTGRTRPPIVTILAGLGMLVALFGLRRRVNRFMIAGLAFSLFLYAGPDDHPWLNAIPLVSSMQTFRCTYLVELFAFGLVGIGARALVVAGWRAALRLRTRTFVLPMVLVAVPVATGSVLCAREVALLGARHVRPHDQVIVDEFLDAASSIPDSGYPFRLHSLERWAVFKNWMASGGFRTICTHWAGVGPDAGMRLCKALRKEHKRADLFALAGVRYFSGRKERIGEFATAKDSSGRLLYPRIANGPDHRGKDNSWHYLLDSGRESLLVRVPGRLVAVDCDDAAWVRVIESWLATHADDPLASDTPFPVRVDLASKEAPAALASARGLLLLRDAEALPMDLPSLDGGIVTMSPIRGAGADVAIDPGRPLWKQIEAALRGRKEPPAVQAFEANLAPWTTRSNQRFAFDVSARSGALAILPTQAVPGWTARVDGERVPVFAAGPDLVGVFTHGGAQRLELVWEMPGWHRATLWVSLAALVAALLAIALGRRGGASSPRRGPYTPAAPLVFRLGRAVGRYGVFSVLVCALAWSFVKVAAFGTGPMPQCPPQGLVLETDEALLQWSEGTREGRLRLEVTARHPDGRVERVVDEEVVGVNRRLERLRPGATYAWRILEDGAPSPTAEFRVSPYAVRF